MTLRNMVRFIVCEHLGLMNVVPLQEEKIFDSLKRSSKAFNVDDDKLSLRQKRAIQMNRCLVLIYGKKARRTKWRSFLR